MGGSFPDSTTSLPVTGLFFPTASSDVTADYMPPSLQEEVIEALETDEQVTGKTTGEISRKWILRCKYTLEEPTYICNTSRRTASLLQLERSNGRV